MRRPSIALLTVVALLLAALGIPSADAAPPYGRVTVDARQLGDDVQVRFLVENGPNPAGFPELGPFMLPAEVAASASCTSDRVPGPRVLDNGRVVGARDEPSRFTIRAGQSFSITCVFPSPTTCGLIATAEMTWARLGGTPLDPPFVAADASPVSAKCVDPVEARSRRATLGISAEPVPNAVERGEITTWHVTITNYTGRTIRNAVIQDRLPEALEPRASSLPSGSEWDPANRILTIPVPALASGESVVISFPTMVRAWSQIPNLVQVRAGNRYAAVQSEVWGIVDFFG